LIRVIRGSFLPSSLRLSRRPLRLCGRISGYESAGSSSGTGQTKSAVIITPARAAQPAGTVQRSRPLVQGV